MPETKWVKFGTVQTITFLGKEIIAIASGLHIIFINLNTKEERVEKFDSRERGEGVCCLAGHPIVPMFAISERRANPKVRVYTYPSINKVSDCMCKSEKNLSGYLSSAFAGTDYLLTLTSLPYFRIIIWLWRTGEQLTATDTTISDESQLLSCSPMPPIVISQSGLISGKLIVYELNVCSRVLSLTSIQKYEKITSSSWTYDGNLFVSDDVGNIYLMPNDGKRRQFIVASNDLKASVVSFRGGVAVADSSKITFFRKTQTERIKSGNPWKIIWEIGTSSQGQYLARHPQRDSILFRTIKGEISEVSVGDDDIPRLQTICQQGSRHLLLISLQPGKFIATIDTFDQLNLFETQTGQLIGKMSLEKYGTALSAVSHPVLPLLAVATTTGKCLILNLFEPANPLLLNYLHLIREPLDRIQFSQSGKFLTISNITTGRIFILDGFETDINVWNFLDITEKLVDYLIYEAANEDLWMVTLVRSHKNIPVGKYFVVYSAQGRGEFRIGSVIKLTELYESLHYGNYFGEMIVNPFLTKQWHLIKFQSNFENFILVEAHSLPHRVRNININTDGRYILTFGFDGLITVRSRTNRNQLLTLLSTHHRQQGGINCAILANNFIVSLGKNGTLVSTKLSSLEATDMNFGDAVALLTNSTRIQSSEDGDDATWLELREAQMLAIERNEVELERTLILSDFHNLKNKLRILIDDNEKASESAKLSLENFDLDKSGREQIIEGSIKACREQEKRLEIKASRENEISKFLRKLCWESMDVVASSLISLDGIIKVDNYAIPRINDEKKIERNWEKFSVDLSTKLSSTEDVYIKDSLRENSENAESLKSRKLLRADENDEEEKFTLAGTTAHHWIREDPSRIINQILQHGSFSEAIRRNTLSKIREEKLKMFFNKLFEIMRARKVQEIKLAKERIAKIHHFSMELKQMFQVLLTVDHSWLKLEWQETEKPETVVKVEDEQVYRVINDSMNEMDVKHLDNSVTQDRVNIFVDCFRSEALQRMMNGVLEVKWEDDIKKDVPKPDCLMKDAASYTEDDMKIIEKYKKAVNDLEKHRQKYRKVLEEDIECLKESLESNVINFNKEMELFYLKRLKMESAILQEVLMRLRESQRHQLRLKGMDEVARLELEELTPAIEHTKKLMEESSILESTVIETRMRYENLLKRDKLLETKFRGEFTDLKQPMVEHLLRQYKKRPRLGQLTCTSITYLTEMGKCILSGEKSEILVRECVDYLKGIDSLDLMPSGLPSQIDSSHWLLLCKLRRTKVEIEIRLKSCAVELAEAEQTLGSHQKTIQTWQNKVQQLKETITERKRHNAVVMRNMEVQFVLKMGQIETQLSGDRRDLDNAVLVPFEEVLRVNDAIGTAGRKKLRAMRRTMEFRRIIEWREWQHACMELTLKDMEQDLKTLQAVKVTKEIQKSLMRHHSMEGVDKDIHIWEKSLVSTNKRFSRILDTDKSRLFETIKSVNLWQKRNDRLSDRIERVKTKSCQISMIANDEMRTRYQRFLRMHLKAIMKRNRLIKKIHDNYGELVSFQTQLELLRLKTYPTLRLKDARRLKNKK